MEEEKNISKKDIDISKKKNSILFTILKRHKIAILIILFMVMVSSTFAWFVFNKTVDMSLHAHVRSWNVSLGENPEIEDDYVLEVAALYPGMTTIDTSRNGGGIPVTNTGELGAKITIDILSISLFGKEQVLDEDYSITSIGEGSSFSIDGYPFVLSFILGESELNSGANTSIDYSLVWEYENEELECIQDEEGNPYEYNVCDVEDTIFGENSYKYSKENPDAPSLVIKLRLHATQAN